MNLFEALLESTEEAKQIDYEKHQLNIYLKEAVEQIGLYLEIKVKLVKSDETLPELDKNGIFNRFKMTGYTTIGMSFKNEMNETFEYDLFKIKLNNLTYPLVLKASNFEEHCFDFEGFDNALIELFKSTEFGVQIFKIKESILEEKTY